MPKDKLDALIANIPDARIQEPLKIMAQRVQTMEFNVEKFLEVETLYEKPVKESNPISFIG